MPSNTMGTMDDGDFFGEFQKRVASKRDDQRLINLSKVHEELFEDHHSTVSMSTTSLLGNLFVFYCSKFAHSFIAEDSDYNFIPQEAAVELLVSSELEQHVLEYIWYRIHALFHTLKYPLIF